MEQILRDVLKEFHDVLDSSLSNDEAERVIGEYYEKIMDILPKRISEDLATYSNEASYIRGWNACVEQILNPQ